MISNLLKSLKLLSYSAIMFSAAFCVACGSGGDDVDKNGGGEKPDPGDDQYEDIKVVDGKVRFYLQEAEDAARRTMGVPEHKWGGTDAVTVNGKTYGIERDEKGKKYIEVSASSSSSYNATLTSENSEQWYGSSSYADLKIPYSQFWSKTAASMQNYPMFATYAKENGNKLIFNDCFALVDVVLTGSAKISSVKVENIAGKALAGFANYVPSRGTTSITKGVDFAVLNCTNDGQYVALKSSTPTHFCLPIAPANYSEGLRITVCDANHRAMVHTVSAAQLAAGKVFAVELKYAPDKDLVFYESFDNFVWGGNIMAGSSSVGFAPDATAVSWDSAIDRDGYADSYTGVDCNVAGTGFIQSNTWADCSGKTLATSHVVTDSYLASRNIGDWTYMFRCQEYQGCIAVGGATTTRGIMQTGNISNIEGLRPVKISFDFCPQSGAQDNMLFQVLNGGFIETVTLNGLPVELTENNSGYKANGSMYIADRNAVKIPASDIAAKEWNRVEVTVKNATDGTMLYWAGNDALTAGKHGFYIDNVEVRVIGDSYNRGENTLRVLYWNIQNGMWADQHNNYDNFVKWVKSYNPDVCVWCESATIYKDNTSSSQSSSLRFLPAGWASLAARYGHAYAAVGGHRDNYPQTVTSKYPIETLLKITDSDVSGKPISHGAAIQQLNVNGKLINIVTLHMWPQAYAFGVTGDANRNDSAAKKEGDYYREFEMKYIVKETVNNSKYAAQQDWLMMGDFNSRSRLDEWYYNYGDVNDTRYLVHNHILDNTNMIDIIANYYPGCFISSTYGTARIDFMYASPSMYEKIENTMTVMDKWTSAKQSPYVSNFYDPSDHRPILTDFNLK